MKKKSLLEKLLYREQALENAIRACGENRTQKERLQARLAELKIIIAYIEEE